MKRRATGRARAPRSSRPRTNEQISEATRRKLLAAGRRLFATRGYAQVSAEQIADKARLTRGALHYQFGDKRGLFEAVARELLGELTRRVYADTMAEVDEGTAELERGCEVLLAAYGEPELQAILLRDAPVVLGWAEWRRLQDESGLASLLGHALEHWVEAGWIGAERVEPLARLLLGALTQAGVAIGEADDRPAALARYRAEVRHLVRGLAPHTAKELR
ncbi:MAG: TetR family transcriptional regulator [Proteobacteria bacterium]|nr:MAG: TetR family transcriptional regulator [Pseudomonadota bacterium]